MVPPNYLLHFYTGRLLKRVELYFILGGLVVFLTATRTTPDTEANHTLTTNQKIDSLINFALTFQGVPYRYGGKNPQGFDCSGFTHYVFSQIGVHLNASSHSQFSQGEAVAVDSARKGDLVFFRNTNNKINHVGIVIDRTQGDVSFIHASSSRGIRIDHIENPYYKKRLVGLKRVISRHF